MLKVATREVEGCLDFSENDDEVTSAAGEADDDDELLPVPFNGFDELISMDIGFAEEK